MISFVIRTYNERAFADRLIEKLRAQSLSSKEIIFVDSGSTDGTVELLEKSDVRLLQIKKEDFNYSFALNLGIEHSKGEYIAILSGHSIPKDDDWAEKITVHFNDESVAGVYGRQIPWPDADAYERFRLTKIFGHAAETFTGKSENTDLHFSNAASCIRKSLWQKHPFAIIPACEDREWANWMLENNYKIIYEPSAVVYHSHTEHPRKAASRLIEIEKTGDLQINRKRNALVTLRQAAGLFVRDMKRLSAIEENSLKKMLLTKRSAERSFWYAYDFNRHRND